MKADLLKGKRIAVVEDDPDIRGLVCMALEKAGCQALGFETAGAFLGHLARGRPDLVILDLMLPDGDGLDLCRHLRSEPQWADIPILVLTARGSESDRVLGLELGADDYVVKPFSLKELLARVKALLRRQAREGEGIWVGGVLYLDLRAFRAYLRGEPLNLTSTEFKILKVLASRKGWVFTRGQILDHLWGDEKAVTERSVDVHIKKLRDKLGDAARFIKSVRGVGYKVEDL